MIRQLVKRLGLDRVEDYLSEEVRRAQLKVLQEERKLVAGLLARVEGRIQGLTGGGDRRKGGRPRRAKKGVVRRRKAGESLRDKVLQAAARAGKALGPSNLADLVRELGYKTVGRPESLVTGVHRVLKDRKLFDRVRRGIYRLRPQGKPIVASNR